MSVPFPDRLRGEEVAGVDMVMLDADIAGCVSSWRAAGHLDLERWSVLRSCLDDLDLVLPLLNAEEAEYYQRLQEMAELVHEEASL